MKVKMSGRKAYNDGVLFVCENPKTRDDFGAVKNAASKSDIKKLVKLSYTEVSKREQDIAFAESVGRELSLKVKVMECKYFDSTRSILIGDTLYSLVKFDVDRRNHEVYLYLEEERKLA